MKIRIIAIIAVLYSLLCADMLLADVGTWTQKADFGGTGRNSAVGFSIEGSTSAFCAMMELIPDCTPITRAEWDEVYSQTSE